MKKKLLALLLLACMVIPFGACNQDQTSQSGSGENLTKVTVSEFRGIDWASTYVAEQLGYFEEEGLDVELVIYKDGPIAFQGMHAGDSDFCLLSIEPVMTAYDEGMESKLLLTNTNARPYGFATKPEITSIADLKGKTIFAGMPGSAPYSFVLSMLKTAGLSENDVSFINMEYNAAVIALGEGTIDGAFIDIYNKDTLLAAMPDANILVDATDPETHKEMFGSEVCQTAIVTCTKAFAEENPETVQKFVNAHVKALKWINEHTSEEVAELLLPMFEGMTQEELASKFETVKGTFSETGEITPEGYAPVEEFCLEQGLIENEIPYEDIVATQFMNTALGK